MTLRLMLAVANLTLGVVYTSYGWMTIVDLRRGWREMGFSHFGMAWIAMAFTCGPHHLEHGLHLMFAGRNACPLDLLAVLIGFPAGVIWFLLRVEALWGGRGDRSISGTPRWVAVLPWLAALYVVGLGVAVTFTLDIRALHFGPRYTPNLLLLWLYGLIGYYLVRTQLSNRRVGGGWSVSGLALSFVFPTCGLMHAVYVAYATAGRYDIDIHGLVVDWLSVPAAVYFVWVVRELHLGSLRDWNRGAAGVRRQLATAS